MYTTLLWVGHLQSIDWSTIDKLNSVIFFFLSKNTIQSEETDHTKCYICTKNWGIFWHLKPIKPISQWTIITSTLTNQLSSQNFIWRSGNYVLNLDFQAFFGPLAIVAGKTKYLSKVSLQTSTRSTMVLLPYRSCFLLSLKEFIVLFWNLFGRIQKVADKFCRLPTIKACRPKS